MSSYNRWILCKDLFQGEYVNNQLSCDQTFISGEDSVCP